jgi:hypothetical protein
MTHPPSSRVLPPTHPVTGNSIPEQTPVKNVCLCVSFPFLLALMSVGHSRQDQREQAENAVSGKRVVSAI